MMNCRILVIICGIASPVAGVVVPTQYGPVRGRAVDVDNGVLQTSVHEFRGVPFAKPPIGPLRFMSPEPPEPWTETLDTLAATSSCPQRLEGTLSITNPEWYNVDEDCLYLDIYTPDAESGPGTLPVTVYIYGGGYQQGGSIQHPGHLLALHGVVVVVLNYRLNALGFAYTGNAAAPGNAGLWDQKLGLEFVRANIANFGGDPDMVTVFGQSAGAGSTSLQMLSPRSKDLFNQAILMSGAETNYWTIDIPESKPETFIRQVSARLGCDVPDDAAMMDCLREVPSENITENSQIECTPGYGCIFGCAPVVDGPDGFLPSSPQELRESGDIMNGPIVSGITQDDGSLSIYFMLDADTCCNRTEYLEALEQVILNPWLPAYDDATVQDVMAAVDWFYTRWPYVDDTDLNRDALVRISTDTTYGRAWDDQLKQHQAVNATYGYVFDYRSKLNAWPEWMGVTHAADIAYVFGTPMLKYNPHIVNDSFLAPDIVTYFDDDDIQYSLFVQQLFTNFAKYGDPTYMDVQKPSGDPAAWPRFSLDRMEVLHLTPEVAVTAQYRQKEYAFIREYMDYVINDVTAADAGSLVWDE